MRYLIIFLLFSFNSLWAQDCRVNNISLNTFNTAIDQNSKAVEHSMTVSREIGGPNPNCTNFNVYFGQGNANSYSRKAFNGSSSISYNVYSDINLATVLKDFGDANSGEFLSMILPQPNINDTVSWYFGVPGLMDIFNAEPGTYTDVLPINIYAIRNNGEIQFQTSRHLTVSINIPRFARLSLVGENEPFDPSSTSYTMNFGNMSTNQEMGADLRVQGNVGFGITMASQNGSRLEHLTNNDFVNYEVKVGDGSFVPLTPAGNPVFVGQSNTRTNEDGKRFNVRVRLGDVLSNLEGGQYQDVITVTVQAW